MNDFPKIALGTWLMGGTKDPDPNNDDEADIQKILLAVKSGVRLIDTAQNYANGKCEELVGGALKRLDLNTRSQVEIMTKHSRAKLNSNEEIKSAIEGSLKRLDVDAVDYYLLHAPAEDGNTVKLKNYFAVVSEFVDSGRIKNIGVSNFSIELLEYVKKISKHPIKVNQVSLNIFNRKAIESGLFDYCIKVAIAFQAYRPIAASLEEVESNSLIAKLAKEKNLTRHQVALAYLLRKGACMTISASSKKHWDDILQLVDENPLTDIDVELIENLIPSSPHIITDHDAFVDAKLN